MKIFKEEQRFTQTWLIIGLTIACIAITFPIIKDWSSLQHKSIYEYFSIFSGHLILGTVIVLFLFLRLETRIDEHGIHYQFFPIHFSLKTILWIDIEKAFVRTYAPITEYGGWGLKGGFPWNKKKGKAINVSGDIGIQLELKNGEKLLIGTQKEQEAKRILERYQNRKTI